MNSGYEYQERVPAAAAGRTVLDWLCARYRHSSGTTWRARLAAGELSLDGAGARRPATCCAPASVSSGAGRRGRSPTVPLSFAVLYRDADLLAVAKPRGLPSLPNGGFLEHTLLFRVRPLSRGRADAPARPRHLRPRALRADGAARRRRGRRGAPGGVEKEYRALVIGAPRQAFTVDVPIGLVPHPRLGTVHAARRDGRAALSHVRVLGPREGGTLVCVTIATGRPHQIRIHLAAAGHPLVGDPLYAAGGVPWPTRRRCPAPAAIGSTPGGSGSRTRRRERACSSSALRLRRFADRAGG